MMEEDNIWEGMANSGRSINVHGRKPKDRIKREIKFRMLEG